MPYHEIGTPVYELRWTQPGRDIRQLDRDSMACAPAPMPGVEQAGPDLGK